jgi:S1-C subfamily serine protease
MKKKLFTAFLALMMISGTAYAATAINGMYKGNPILKLTANGVPLKVTDVPAMNFVGRTVVPVYLLRQLGVQVDYNAKTQTVDVKMPQQPAQPQPVESKGLTLEQLNKIGESVGLVYVLNAQGQQIGTGSGFITNGNVFVTNWHVAENATTLRIDFGGTNVFTVQTKDALFKNELADLFAVNVERMPSLNLNVNTPKNKEKVYAVGYPHHKFTITEGLFVSNWNADRWVHSAKTMAGASGGALINVNGEVIGITTASNDGYLNIAVQAKVLQEELKKL